MSVLGSLYPAAKPFLLPAAIASGDEVLVYRADGPEQVDSVYSVSNATIAAANDTVRLEVGKKAGGTGAFTQVADFPAADGWTADTPRTGTMTSTVANTKLVEGDWLAVKPTLAGTGAISAGHSLIVNVISGHKN